MNAYARSSQLDSRFIAGDSWNIKTDQCVPGSLATNSYVCFPLKERRLYKFVYFDSVSFHSFTLSNAHCEHALRHVQCVCNECVYVCVWGGGIGSTAAAATNCTIVCTGVWQVRWSVPAHK